MLTTSDEEEALQGIVDAARELAHAPTAALVLPGIDDAWVIEMAAGDYASNIIGLEPPAKGSAMDVIRTSRGIVAPAPPGRHVLHEITEYGPSLYAPSRPTARQSASSCCGVTRAMTSSPPPTSRSPSASHTRRRWR
ncbi:hypothetical protein GCM10025876_05840 [Demequina litorisediminis]|uniref:Uncharacterized protein n=1 Tax=Demequina litorisediminis TaxID=1849022 RepID=A0ABQ6IAJ9_9MICO|nr:hypothetical protein [Demequina litorisediminis]GMA34380.1 hypothetical protein GCM10025876_05840 [Demequina litorisediminis]